MLKKLTAQGPKDRKSYTVTLPLEWVKAQNLHKNRQIELDVVKSKIILSAKKEESEAAFIDLNYYPNTLLKVLQALYRKGLNEIKIHYTNPQQLGFLTSIINTRLLGYEIIEQKKDYLIIKDITKESSEDFDTVLRRIFLLLLELTGATDQITIDTLDSNIKKLVNYCQRVLIKQGHLEYSNVPFYYNLLDQLEKLADEYTWVLPLKPTAGQHKLQQMKQCTRKAYDLYYKFTEEEFDNYESLTYKIRREIRREQKIDVFDMHIHNLARLLNTMYANIFALRAKL